MVANESQFASSHQLRIGQVYYEIVTHRTDAGFRAEWVCLKCRPSAASIVLPLLSNDEAYEAARLDVARTTGHPSPHFAGPESDPLRPWTLSIGPRAALGRHLDHGPVGPRIAFAACRPNPSSGSSSP